MGPKIPGDWFGSAFRSRSARPQCRHPECSTHAERDGKYCRGHAKMILVNIEQGKARPFRRYRHRQDPTKIIEATQFFKVSSDIPCVVENDSEDTITCGRCGVSWVAHGILNKIYPMGVSDGPLSDYHGFTSVICPSDWIIKHRERTYTKSTWEDFIGQYELVPKPKPIKKKKRKKVVLL